jgi:DNA polymerase gamma 1
LPPLQGSTISEHFQNIGSEVAEPWLAIAKQFSQLSPIPPKPDNWVFQPGWTKYYSDGSFEHVPDLGEEDMLCFDVETMPPYHQYPVMACAMSSTAWYTWISPWMLGLDENPEHLIPLGDPTRHRIVVGHNVSYDRARVLEEYSVKRSNNRFLDTMALHIAVKGISSHQRPAWMSHRKAKEEHSAQKEETVHVVEQLVLETKKKRGKEVDKQKQAALLKLQKEMEESLPQLLEDEEDSESDVSGNGSRRWEDIASANSLADVAMLHCGIKVDKTIRNDFMTHTPEQIRSDIDSYLSYCAQDVEVTYAVFSKVLPLFLDACPSPVTFAGVLCMGSSFLTVDESWEKYLEQAEGKYKELEDSVRTKLVTLAMEAKELYQNGQGDPKTWESDPWLRQLDWNPKTPGPTRGVEKAGPVIQVPKWYHELMIKDPLKGGNLRLTVPFLLGLTWDGHPLFLSSEHGWVCRMPLRGASDDKKRVSPPADDVLLTPLRHEVDDKKWAFFRLPFSGLLLGKSGVPYIDRFQIREELRSKHGDLLSRIISATTTDGRDAVGTELREIADEVVADRANLLNNVSIAQLRWADVDFKTIPEYLESSRSLPSLQPHTNLAWPRWFFDLSKPKEGKPPGELDLTTRSRMAPVLLRLSWLGYPIVASREHGFTFRVPRSQLGTSFTATQKPLVFTLEADEQIQIDADHAYFKLPHKDGESANVGSPLAKTFLKYAMDGTLSSPSSMTQEALDMNAQCSYWISARDRVLKQMVVWNGNNNVDISLPPTSLSGSQKWGIILPQVVTMGTVTRRAVEKTWLTASNAKKNRVGSELKAMVRAPDGYAIVGADVDSEELWISSVMGDAQFGFHGATAVGWMTLEGTKAAGTDLHSKTAAILGISRDQAKVFNYSRIYGAGMRHAVLLLRQSNASMTLETAQNLAEKLYVSTKGKNTHHAKLFGRKFWYGGTESYLFNKLEQIALSECPRTPALGCGITSALSKEHLTPGFGTDYMPSRINWVVQSSGVDYLHLLLCSMEHLIDKYHIQARYLISVHDEVRYLVREEDKYRVALALQVANLWTRCLFAFRLGMDDLPQGVAFFSAVDVDKVLRKEVDMPCVTPSHPDPIPPGESLDISVTLTKTGGSLWPDQATMAADFVVPEQKGERTLDTEYLAHRAPGPEFLRAQATTEVGEIRMLASVMSRKRPQKGSVSSLKRAASS